MKRKFDFNKAIEEAYLEDQEDLEIFKNYQELDELSDVIYKEGDHWKIRGHKGKNHNEKDGDWPQNFKTRQSAENALKAYHAHKK